MISVAFVLMSAHVLESWTHHATEGTPVNEGYITLHALASRNTYINDVKI
jgi:hypothetical protein